ncbi:MAG: hypothetical protein GY853_16950 [PVC group bacterium]|nr:hypothetical protein [PVC group bacterium]
MRRFKDADQSWHVVFDFYRNKIRNLTKAQLSKDTTVPKLYKEIREAEIACQLQINNDNFQMEWFSNFSKCKTTLYLLFNVY